MFFKPLQDTITIASDGPGISGALGETIQHTLRWFGHIERKKSEAFVKKVYE